MPKNMSFLLTTQQIRKRTKTVTRRIGWRKLKAGDIVNACVKCQGLKSGERIEKLAQIEIVSTRIELLHEINEADVRREGFPNMTPAEFVELFCSAMRCEPDIKVNRIEFQYIQ